MLTPTSGYIHYYEMRAFYEASTDYYHFLAFGMVNRPQPDSNRDDSQYGYQQNFKFKYNDAGGSSPLARYNYLRFDGANAGEQITSSAKTDWSNFIPMSNKTNGVSVTDVAQTGINLKTEKGIFSSRYEGSGGTFGTSIDALIMERNPDIDNTSNIEITGCHKETPSAYEWTPYDENESASAYVLKQLVVKNPLVVNAATCESRTYPIFRAVGGVD